MKLDYFMDISIKSESIGNTPVAMYQRLPFYVHNCGHIHAGHLYFTEREGQDDYLLIYTLSGSGYLKFKNAEYTLEPNKAVLINCLEYHYYKTASKTPWEFKFLHLNGTAIKEYYKIINGDALSVVAMGESPHINGMINSIYDFIVAKEILLDIKICTVLMNILTEIITCMHGTLNNSKFNQHKVEIERVISFISTNYGNKISTDDMTELVHISKYHFLRLFKTYTGLSPYEYLINYRINMSKSLLKDTSSSVNEISCCVGFNDVNNFIRYFKRLTGTTPANYRKFWIH